MDNKVKTESLSIQDKTFGIDVESFGPFGENTAGVHAYKRTEKLLAALYLVTNFVPESEPARHAIRDKSIGMLPDILELRSGFRSAGSEKIERVIALVCEIKSLLDIIHIAGFISDMNLTILQRELHNLIVFLRDSENSDAAEKITFSAEHFAVADKGQYKGHVKRDNVSFSTSGSKDSSANVREKQKTKVRVSEAHIGRREQILSIVKDKNQVTIKDISTSIADCSEKTIQRELLALVQSGVLKKEGERRWSVYSRI